MKTSSKSCWVIIPAAGIGKRMRTSGDDMPKQYLPLGECTILEITLARIDQVEGINGVVLVLAEDDPWWPQLQINLDHELVTVTGGNERFHSVLNGLMALDGRVGKQDWILVHDVVRPCVRVADINKLVATLAADAVGGILATPVRETLKRTSGAMTVAETVSREDYWLAGTPQMFRFESLLLALEQARESGTLVTDEAHAMEMAGHTVQLVQGEGDNIKITHPADLALAEHLLNRQAAP